MNIAEFIVKWKRAELKEKSAAQEFFIDLCRLVGHPTPAEADPTGDTFCFEKGVAKAGGAGVPPAQGFADVWKHLFFGWEFKGKHKDLDAAFDQLLLYKDDLANPPLLVVCDMDRIVIRTNFTGTVPVTHDIPIEKLGEPRNIEILRHVFFDAEKLKPGKTSEAVTQEAAEQFAGIAESMRKRGLDSSQVAHFLDRVVFCLFAEDIGLLPDQIFTRIVDKSSGDPAKFTRLIGQLFDAMAKGGEFGLESIRHFNGNLFDNTSSPDLTVEEIKRIAATSRLDWSAVDPSIFGTLFERGLDPAKRAQLGAHFTGRADIEDVVENVVMKPLRQEWQEAKGIIGNLLTTGRKTTLGGAGVPPAQEKAPREWHSRGYLPHFDHPGLVQTITFRLADSLPEELTARLAREREKVDRPELRKEIEEALDRAHGACHLRDLRIGGIVRDALLHFDGVRYRLLAWVIMPNHVHAMIETVPGHRLDEVVHSWKSFTAKECNKALGRTGAFWQEDYFDRFIRDAEHYRKAKAYIEENPVNAKFATTAADWALGSASTDAGETPAPPAAPHAVSPPQLRKARGEATSILHRFLARLHAVKVLDPACGSGNFLYVTLLKLKDLEKEIILYAMEKGLGGFLPMVGPWQLYGIEINPYAFDLAQMTVWIGWLQWIRFNGFGQPQEPILRTMSGNFQCRDAILDFSGGAGVPGLRSSPSEAGSPASSSDGGQAARAPAEPDWPKVDFIVGNPPFLGDKMMRRELGDAYVDTLRALYAGRIPGQSDLCCYWFEKARAHIAAGQCKRAGLLATQGIRGGANREVLKKIKETGDIFWAVSDRDWILDGANVHVSVVGFDDRAENERRLDGISVQTINSNLTAVADIASAQVLNPNVGLGFIGTTKKAPLDIAESVALPLLASPNPHGRPNSEVVRPWMNGLHLTRREPPRWIIDYPITMTQAEAALYETPFAFVVQNVKPLRENHREPVQSKYWWRQARPCPDMQDAVKTLPRFIATPRVAKHRLFAWIDPVVVPDCQLVVFARSDDYFFGVLHSRLHEVWALAQGTQLREKESGFRYTPTTCFETFPFPGSLMPENAAAKLPGEAGPLPTPSPALSEAIAAAARELDQHRRNWLNPPEWTREEILEFPGTVGGPWDRYIAPNSAIAPDLSESRGQSAIALVRYPRLVPRDADSAAKLAKRTLTNLYNQRPQWLADAHRRLDEAVFAAYGWTVDLTDEQILERLLALNVERAGMK